jgi:hypothetical protein
MYSFCKGSIIRREETSLNSGKILGRIKAKCGTLFDRADSPSLIGGSEAMSCVIYDLQIMFVSYFSISSIWQGLPAMCTRMIAFVLAVIALYIASGCRLSVSFCTSTKIGWVPVARIMFAVAGHVTGIVITSSPGPISFASRAG